MRTIFETKEPEESFIYSVNFSDDMNGEEAISSVVIDDGSESGIPGTIDGKEVTFRVSGGVAGERKIYHVAITTSDANVCKANVIWEIVEQPGTTSLVTISELRSYLKIEHREEDVLLNDILREVEAIFRQLVRRAIEVETVDEVVRPGGKETTLFLKNFPVNDAEDFVVLDSDDEEVDEDNYELDPVLGTVVGDFSGTYYTVTYTGGLSVSSRYSTEILPSIKRAIKLWASDTYYHRSPRVTSEKLGDETTHLDGIAVPRQVASIINFYRSKNVFT